MVLLEEEERNLSHLSTRSPFLAFSGWREPCREEKVTSGQRKALSPSLAALGQEQAFCREQTGV